MLAMDEHIRTCEVALAMGGKPTGASLALAKRLRNHRARSAAGMPDIPEEHHLGGSGMCAMSESGDDGDPRIPCQCCGRRFAMDRIGKHQAVCQKVSAKKAPQARLFHTAGPGKAAPLATSNWRKHSQCLRQACRAGRGTVEPGSSDAPCNQTARTSEVAPRHSPGQKRSCPATILIEEKFNRLDVDNDGVLSREEMDGFLKSMDRYASSATLDMAFRNIDKEDEDEEKKLRFEEPEEDDAEDDLPKRKAKRKATGFVKKAAAEPEGKLRFAEPEEDDEEQEEQPLAQRRTSVGRKQTAFMGKGAEEEGKPSFAEPEDDDRDEDQEEQPLATRRTSVGRKKTGFVAPPTDKVGFESPGEDGDGFVDLQDFSACILGGMGTTKKPAAGSALDHIRRKGAPKPETLQNAKRVPGTPQMPKPSEFRRRPRSASLSSPTHPGAKTRRRSTGAIRSAEPLPAWGSAEGSSRYGVRQCITSASDTWKCARTPHNTASGGCSTVPVTEKEGVESNRCSPGNPLDRSWLYENSTLQPSFSPAPRPQAPVLLGRTSFSQPSPTPSKTLIPTKPAVQARSSSSSYHPRRRNTQKLHVHFE